MPLNFDPALYTYPSRRALVYGRNGMVASNSPIASDVGLDILKSGGNAIDAAVAVGATLGVVEPISTGLAGDLNAIVWYEGKMYGLNATGKAAELSTRENYLKKGSHIPKFSMEAITVPGQVKGWSALIDRFGTKTLSEVLEPAARIAEEGWVVPVTVGEVWSSYQKQYEAALPNNPTIQTWFDFFTKNGEPYKAGDIFKSQAQADTLREIGATNGDSYYKGDIASDIEDFMIEHGGYIRKSDLEAYDVEWVEPMSVNYRGLDVWQLPPNGIGIINLLALNNLEQLELNQGIESVDTYHKQMEAVKLAFEDGLKYIGDSRFHDIDYNELLTKEYAAKRMESFREDSVYTPHPRRPLEGGTVYFSVVDKDGNMVSFIQSNCFGFGSGAVLEDRGLAFHARGAFFRLEEGHPNTLEPFKRPFHTIIPSFLTKDGKPIGPFGCMGSIMQPQAQTQIISSMVDFGLNPQDAFNKPRWQWVGDKEFQFEPEIPVNTLSALARIGHDVSYVKEHLYTGRAQMIIRREDGVLIGATEGRGDGHISTY